MSEKIYAYLLRLFPSAFRKHYQEEALRLIRDRLSDERGFFLRLRLSFDLITDLIGALPQAYRHSYAEVAAVAAPTPRFDAIPLFRVLQKEPIRGGTIVFAGALSLTVAAAFMYVMVQPVPYHPVARNGRISPIEAVLEHLNQPMTTDLAGIELSDASASTSADTGRSVSATGAAPQLAPSAQHIPDDHISAAAAAEPSSQPPVSQQAVPRHPEGILVPARSPSPFNMQTPAAVANLSGEWALRSAGGDAGIPRWFIFRQDGAELRGAGGQDFTERYPIIHGVVAGESVKFELNNRRRTFLYDLRFEGKELRGTSSIKIANEIRSTTVWLKRIQ